MYFLVDTVTTHSSSRIATILKEGKYIYYHLLCLCLKDRADYPRFRYPVNSKETKKLKTINGINFTSWATLGEAIYQHQLSFGKAHLMHIVERLPDGTYILNTVEYEYSVHPYTN